MAAHSIERLASISLSIPAENLPANDRWTLYLEKRCLPNHRMHFYQTWDCNVFYSLTLCWDAESSPCVRKFAHSLTHFQDPTMFFLWIISKHLLLKEQHGEDSRTHAYAVFLFLSESCEAQLNVSYCSTQCHVCCTETGTSLKITFLLLFSLKTKPSLFTLSSTSRELNAETDLCSLGD